MLFKYSKHLIFNVMFNQIFRLFIFHSGIIYNLLIVSLFRQLYPSTVENSKAYLPKIMIAEDTISNYLLLEFLLKNDYKLIHAQNGIEAISLFKASHPQLILMDIKMPKMNGYEATAEIRKISEEIPIIAVTAYAFKEDIENILECGFNAYLVKPINNKELKKTIESFFK